MFYSFELHFLNSFVKAHGSWNVYVSQKACVDLRLTQVIHCLPTETSSFSRLHLNTALLPFCSFDTHYFFVRSHWSPFWQVLLTELSTFADVMLLGYTSSRNVLLPLLKQAANNTVWVIKIRIHSYMTLDTAFWLISQSPY